MKDGTSNSEVALAIPIRLIKGLFLTLKSVLVKVSGLNQPNKAES